MLRNKSPEPREAEHLTFRGVSLYQPVGVEELEGSGASIGRVLTQVRDLLAYLPRVTPVSTPVGASDLFEASREDHRRRIPEFLDQFPPGLGSRCPKPAPLPQWLCRSGGGKGLGIP